MTDPITNAELETSAPMMGPVAASITGGVMVGAALAVVILFARNRVGQLRNARTLERRFAKKVELREGDAELVGVVERVTALEDGAPPRRAVVRVRIVETAIHGRRSKSWSESSRRVAIDEFVLRVPGTEERVLVSPGGVVRLVVPEPRTERLETRDKRASHIEIREGEEVLVHGRLEGSSPALAREYRDAVRPWRMRAPEGGAIVITPASTARSLRKWSCPPSSKGAIAVVVFSVLGVALLAAHLMVFQLAGPIVNGTVTGFHTSKSKGKGSTMLAEITYLDAAGGEHRLDRALSYFKGPVERGMGVRVKYFPGIPADGELLFDVFSLGLVDALGSAGMLTPLLIALLFQRRRFVWGTQREFRVR